jgi:hypothetical protein
MFHVTIGNRDVAVEDDVVGVLVTEAKLHSMEDEILQLRSENKSLLDTVHKLKQTLLGYVLEAENAQNLEPPADFEDYPFSEN